MSDRTVPTPATRRDDYVENIVRFLRERLAQAAPGVAPIVRAAQDFEMAARADAFGMGAGSSRMLDSRNAGEAKLRALFASATTEVLADLALITGSATSFVTGLDGGPPKESPTPTLLPSNGGYGWSKDCDSPDGPCGCGATHAPLRAPEVVIGGSVAVPIAEYTRLRASEVLLWEFAAHTDECTAPCSCGWSAVFDVLRARMEERNYPDTPACERAAREYIDPEKGSTTPKSTPTG